MHALILAGGFGTRLRDVEERPKPLVEIAGKTLIEHQIDFLRRYGVEDIRILLHYRAEEIIEFCEATLLPEIFGDEWYSRVGFYVERASLGTGGAIKNACGDLKNPFLVINCDTLIDVDLAQLFSCGANAMVCVYAPDARDFGFVRIEEECVREFTEKPHEMISGFVNAGVYFLTRDIFSGIADDAFSLERRVLPELARRGELRACLYHGIWIDVGTQERLQIAKKTWLRTLS